MKSDVHSTVSVSRRSDVHGGDLVFAGTRVPVRTLIGYLESGASVTDFLEGFPTVSREQVEAFLRASPEGVEKLGR